MQPVAYGRARSQADALALLRQPDTHLLAGGTELLNWARIGIARPARLLDITGLAELARIEPLPGGGLRIGALAKLSDVADHSVVAADYPVLVQSILKAASAQLRHVATLGGNLLQRTRCPYYRAEEATPCNQRLAGSGCAALDGHHEKHAIFGWSEHCVAVQPSDPAVALVALDAVIVVEGAAGARRVPAAQFHALPVSAAPGHNVLEREELIVAIELPAPAPYSAYLKVRERESYEFATVSAAATLELAGGVIRTARVALGSVAMRPWRLTGTEHALVGCSLGSPAVVAAVEAGFQDARPLPFNHYKLALARNAAVRAIALAGRAA